MATRRKATTSKTQKNKNIKSNVRINMLVEGYALHNEGIA
jgi:hypothetical protein